MVSSLRQEEGKDIASTNYNHCTMPTCLSLLFAGKLLSSRGYMYCVHRCLNATSGPDDVPGSGSEAVKACAFHVGNTGQYSAYPTELNA